MFCGPRESSLQSNEVSVGVCNEEERNTGGFGWISDESV